MLPEPLRSSMSITIPRRFNVDRDHDPFQRGHRSTLQKVIDRGADPSLDPGSVDRVERPQRALDVGGPVTLEEAATRNGTSIEPVASAAGNWRVGVGLLVLSAIYTYRAYRF